MPLVLVLERANLGSESLEAQTPRPKEAQEALKAISRLKLHWPYRLLERSRMSAASYSHLRLNCRPQGLM